MIKYVRILPSPPSLSPPLEPTRKPTERQQTLSLYRSDYRPQSGPSQPLQTTSLSLFLSSSPSSSFSLSLSFIAEPGDDNGLRGGVFFLEVSKSFATLFSFLPFSFLFSFHFHSIFTWTKSIGWFFNFLRYYIFYLLIFPFVLQLKIEILYWWRLKYFRSFWN